MASQHDEATVFGEYLESRAKQALDFSFDATNTKEDVRSIAFALQSVAASLLLAEVKRHRRCPPPPPPRPEPEVTEPKKPRGV